MKFEAKILEDLAAWFEDLREVKFSEILETAGKNAARNLAAFDEAKQNLARKSGENSSAETEAKFKAKFNDGSERGDDAAANELNLARKNAKGEAEILDEENGGKFKAKFNGDGERNSETNLTGDTDCEQNLAAISGSKFDAANQNAQNLTTNLALNLTNATSERKSPANGDGFSDCERNLANAKTRNLSNFAGGDSAQNSQAEAQNESFSMPERERNLPRPKNCDEFDMANQNERNLAPNEAANPQNNARNVAFVCVDMIKSFCDEGPLSSPRVRAIAKGVAQAFRAAYERGVRDFVLIEDSHEADCAEFEAFAPHAVRGSEGARTIKELRELPFFDEIKICRKNSLSAAYSAEFNAFLAQNPHLGAFVALGDCTDLCVYQLVSHLKLSANQADIRRKVVVPANLVATYDAPTHEGDFYHALFLRHMQTALGALVVREIKFD